MESDEGSVSFSLKDLIEANIFCNTCGKEVTSFKEFMDKMVEEEVFIQELNNNDPLNKRFEGHLDHSVTIRFNASFDSIRETLKMIMFMHNKMIQETYH